MRKQIKILLLVLLCHSFSGIYAQEKYDIVVYGGTSAGIICAIQGAMKGKRVVLIETGNRIGGMTTGGLGDTDFGNEKAIGGLSSEFYKRVALKYGKKGRQWHFEPKVALAVFQEWLQEYNVPIVYNERLDLNNPLEMNGKIIVRINMESGKEYRGKIFVDATYEGDLLAKAGVSYFVGREASSKFEETFNGYVGGNELPSGIDPYKIKGDTKSGLLRRVNVRQGGKIGDGNKLLQAYNFRMCLTNNPENRIMIEKPDGYLEEDYEILFRAIERGQNRRFFKLNLVSADKTDSNNHSGISTDYIGTNYLYPEADYATRDLIKQQHEIYQKGLVWTLQHHPRVPKEIRNYYGSWGLPKDEFLDNGHWPSQLYVRESRRMQSDYIVTQQIVLSEQAVKDPIGLGSYAVDSHHAQYCVGEDGFVRTEGGFYQVFKKPYSISYRAIVPKKQECQNLLVPVCVSTTHAAYGSIRMEPVFMILGQSAATAAVIAIDKNIAVQNVKYRELEAELLNGKQLMQANSDMIRK